MEQHHLDQINRHVAEVKERIGRQEALLLQHQEKGRDTVQSSKLLENFEASLIQLERHRRLIVAALGEPDKG